MGHPNYFVSLELPVSPFLDEEVLKQNYLRLSSNAHPDRARNVSDDTELDASMINEAFKQLSKMPTRLRHLLLVLTGEAPESLKRIPEAVGDRFMEVGEVLRQADALLREKPGEDASELSRVIFLKKSLPIKGQMEKLQGLLLQDESTLMKRLSTYESSWDERVQAVPDEWIDSLTLIYHEWTFLDKWRQQLGARLLECMV
jgi:hypothetical protein